jgi:hypothetical protein
MAATIAHRLATGVRALQHTIGVGKKLDPAELIQHMLKTYFALRVLLALVGFALPIALLVFGAARGIPWQKSVSDYYHALGNAGQSNRDIFVGCLAATAAMLIAYRGHGRGENWLLNLSGIFTIGVVSFPTEWQCQVDCQGWFSIHGICAISSFICLACVALFCSSNTLRYLAEQDPPAADRFRFWYRVAAVAMIGFPVWAAIQQDHRVFLIEMSASWSFAFYWTIKTLELRRTRLTSPISMQPEPPAAAPAREVPM